MFISQWPVQGNEREKLNEDENFNKFIYMKSRLFAFDLMISLPDTDRTYHTIYAYGFVVLLL